MEFLSPPTLDYINYSERPRFARVKIYSFSFFTASHERCLKFH